MNEKEPLFVIEMSTCALDQSGYISNNFKPDHQALYLNITLLESKCSKGEIY